MQKARESRCEFPRFDLNVFLLVYAVFALND